MNLSDNIYSLRGCFNLTETQFYRLLRTRYDQFEAVLAMKGLELSRDKFMAARPYDLQDLSAFVADVPDGLPQLGMARRRVFFWAIRPLKMLEYARKEELGEDKLVFTCQRTIWDAYGNPKQITVQREYKLYTLDASKLGVRPDGRHLLALLMTCPSTGQQHVVMQSSWSTDISYAIFSLAYYAYNYRQGDVYAQVIPKSYYAQMKKDPGAPAALGTRPSKTNKLIREARPPIHSDVLALQNQLKASIFDDLRILDHLVGES